MHTRAGALSVVREFFQISIEMRECFVFDRARFVTQSFPIFDRIDCRCAPFAKSDDQIAQRAVQLVVPERFQGVLIESVWRAVARRIYVFGWMIHTEKQT